MSDKPTIRLGAFQLGDLLGQGGMGHVYHAVHQNYGVAVALKVISGNYAGNPDYLAGFRREVQAVAALNHPGIVSVFDYGVVTEEAALPSDGILVAGSPWFAMELAAEGSLDQFLPFAGWPAVRRTLLDILDALAHAHARRIVHRDLKPQNVLVTYSEDGPRFKLTDFGIAMAVGTDSDQKTADLTALTAGTPMYMAPELWEARWRDYGPWTDLYALGCLAYELVGGEAPFTGHSVIQIATKHASSPVPALTPRFDVPSGFVSWLGQLLHKRADRRFQRAADAAWALQSIDPGDDRVPDITPVGRIKAAVNSANPKTPLFTLTMPRPDAPTLAVSADEHTAQYEPVAQSPPTAGDSATTFPNRPQFPAHWRTAADYRPPVALASAGLGLFGLREIPLVDRDRERNRIWESLRQVADKRAPRAIVVQGPGGCGKSRLVSWMGQRAHEVGAAQILRAIYGPTAAPNFGLGRMVASSLVCVGLKRSEIFKRTARILARAREDSDIAEQDAAALTALMLPTSDASDYEVPLVRFGSNRERYVAIERLLTVLSAERPLLVWLDDVQWGADGISFVDHCLRSASRLPVLFLLTVRSELLDEQPLETELLDRLYQHPAVSELPIGPLGKSDQLELVRRLLYLSEELAGEVARRSAGNPLYAVQLIGDLIQQRLLRAGADGFQLDAIELDDLPADLTNLWTARLNGLARAMECPQLTLDVLELAAAIGKQVHSAEWYWASLTANLTLPPGLLELMITRGLAEHTEGGWAFSHDMLRDELVARARANGRWPELNRACANMLLSLYPDESPGRDERRAHYLLEAGDLEQALDPLLKAARQHRDVGGYEPATTLLDEYDHVLQRLGLGGTGEHGLRGRLLRAELLEVHGETNKAAVVAHSLLAGAVGLGLADLKASILRLLGTCASNRADFSQALQFQRTALAEYEQQLDDHGLAATLIAIGRTHRNIGEMDEARDAIVRARETAESIGDSALIAGCLQELVLQHVASYDFSEALPLSTELIELSKELGSRSRTARALNSVAEMKRHSGDLAGAEADYREVLKLLEAIGSAGIVAVRFNLGLTLLFKGDASTATAVLQQVLRALPKASFLRGDTGMALAACGAIAGNLQLFDRHFNATKTGLEKSKQVNPDIANTAQLAAERLVAAGEVERARNAYQVAAVQWEALGNLDNYTEVLDRLAALPV